MDKLAIATLRGLSLDLPRQADSGHSGTALALAPLGWLLYSKILRHAPTDPKWPNRDRLVMSNGHACVLLYGLLHLCGYQLSLDDLKEFRTPFSLTPGHPETWVTPGIDASTGPLGQGLVQAVGFAIAEKAQSHDFPELVDHRTYAICSDGDMMEGAASEASSLAGHLKLGKLLVFYDDNGVTIDGETALSFSEDVPARYRAYGWHTLEADGENLAELEEAIESAHLDPRPTLISVKTTIGFPSPTMSGKPEAHSPPFSEEEIRATKQLLGLDPNQNFQVPDQLAAVTRELQERGRKLVAEWSCRVTPEWRNRQSRDWPKDLPIPTFTEDLATRVASGKVQNILAKHLPNLIGGSADLAGSTKTLLSSSSDFPRGRNLRFGVREQAMAGITNGLALYGGLIPFCSTYFAFSDFMKPAIRLAALAKLPGIFVFTHDSLALGGDGPTHQPVEQLAGFRALPNCLVIRPADANETAQAWKLALERTDGPTILVLSRQTLPVLPTGSLERGGYVVQGRRGTTMVASGSEVHLCLQAQAILAEKGVPSRVVSLPCWKLFWQQSPEYREEVLGQAPRVTVEAASTLGWHRIAGEGGTTMGLDRFGASGDGEELMKLYGFTAEAAVQAVLRLQSSVRLHQPR